MTTKAAIKLAALIEELFVGRSEGVVERSAALAAVVKTASILTGESAEEIADQLAGTAAERIIRRRVVEP